MSNSSSVVKSLAVGLVLLSGTPVLADGPQRAAVPAGGVIRLKDYGDPCS